MATKYDKEFRANAVELALVSNQPIAQTARDLGLQPPTFYSWIEAHKKADVSHYPKPKETLEAEVKRLRRELTQAKEERDILKKATVDSTCQCNTL